MNHSREKKTRTKRQASNPYDGMRKIVIDGETWYWSEGNSWQMKIYDPEGNSYIVSRHEVNQSKDYYSCGWSTPGDVRRYIDKSILKLELKTGVDATAVPGKLYAYREISLYQGADIAICDVIGGGILDNAHRAYARIREHLEKQEPLLLLKAWAENERERVCYKVLLQDIICTIQIYYPRTWSGSFVKTTLEWQKEKRSRGQARY